MSSNFFLFLTKNVDLILLNFKMRHFHFFFFKGVGGAEPFLATNHYKIPNIYWKYWNCFENLEFLIPPVGRETRWVKNWRQQWWQRREHKEAAVAVLACAVVCPHTAVAAVGAGAAKQPWLNWETSRSMPRAPQCLVLGFFCRCLFYFVLLCERRNRKQKAWPFLKLAHSKHLGQTLDTTPKRGLSLASPRAESTREKSSASCSAPANLSSVLWPTTSHGTRTITTAFSFKRDMYS